MAHHLGQGMSFVDAYHKAKPGGDRQFMLINGRVSLSRHERLDDVLVLIQENNRQLRESEARILEHLDLRIDEVAEEIRRENEVKFQPRLTKRSAVLWVMGFMVFYLNMFLFYSDVRELLEIQWPVAAIIGLIAVPVSVYLFMSGFGFPIWRV
jgi:hypothetical protein